MTDPEPPSFRERRREADERVRQKNLADRDVTNVVPLRRPKPPPPRRSPIPAGWATHPLVLWTAIPVLLVAWYLLRGLF